MLRGGQDPRGRVSIRVREPEQLSRYRFALAMADFLVCRRCGVYLAAVIPANHKDGARANGIAPAWCMIGLTVRQRLPSRLRSMTPSKPKQPPCRSSV